MVTEQKVTLEFMDSSDRSYIETLSGYTDLESLEDPNDYVNIKHGSSV